ncbi:hypothetical protein RRG08_030161 [Elysia crispata]|uniref:Uncharacterized protein n=1 Tax=Elysia crispata TaxID=231223 RepID=A0AAE0ZRA2_9GAST|nr:hypothetical protein RRG08_030161 [Elysia crispata]
MKKDDEVSSHRRFEIFSSRAKVAVGKLGDVLFAVDSALGHGVNFPYPHPSKSCRPGINTRGSDSCRASSSVLCYNPDRNHDKTDIDLAREKGKQHEGKCEKHARAMSLNKALAKKQQCPDKMKMTHARSKERRMKQLSALGARRHFFRNPRRMRALRPGEELGDAADLMGPGFAYLVDCKLGLVAYSPDQCRHRRLLDSSRREARFW